MYVAFRKTGGEAALPVSTFSNVLKFTSKEIDPATNEPEEAGYEDEYEVAEFDLAGSDYVVPIFASNFGHLWEQVGAAASGDEAEETLQLSGVKSIAGACPWMHPLPPTSCPLPLEMDCSLHLSLLQPFPPPLLLTPCTLHRRYGAAGQDAVAAAARGDRRAGQPDDTHAEAAGQDDQRRAGGG